MQQRVSVKDRVGKTISPPRSELVGKATSQTRATAKVAVSKTDRNLKLIFKSYARAAAGQASSKHAYTFDQMTLQYATLRLGSFIKFCKDFKIPLKVNQQIQVFNKTFELKMKLPRAKDNDHA